MQEKGTETKIRDAPLPPTAIEEDILDDGGDIACG